MRFVLKKGLVKKLRVELGLTQESLAARTGLSLRQLKAYESTDPPSSIRSQALHALGKTFKKSVEELLELSAAPATSPIVRASVGDVPSRAPSWSQRKTTPELEAIINGGSAQPPALNTLAQRATRERQLGYDDVKVETEHGELTLLGLNWFKLIWSRPTKYAGMRLVMVGEVDDHQGLSRPIRKVFKTADGGKFRFVRWLDAETCFYTTVFALTTEFADTLTPIAQGKKTAAIVIRVVQKPPARSWPGFYFYGSERVAFEFGFICEAILPSIPPIRVISPASISISVAHALSTPSDKAELEGSRVPTEPCRARKKSHGSGSPPRTSQKDKAKPE